MTKKKRTRQVGDSININRMIRDVLITSMSKGQLPLALFGIVIIIIVLKMPGEDISNLMSQVFELIVAGKLIGYVLFVFALTGWFVHVRYQRRSIVNEMERLSAERDKWQRLSIGDKVVSSEEEK